MKMHVLTEDNRFAEWSMWVAALVIANAAASASEINFPSPTTFFASPRDREAVKRGFARNSLDSRLHDRRSIAHLRMSG